jgi:glycosyltransferase involved in cell wall biosynthesis
MNWRILHLLSSQRWTGAADPVVNLAQMQQARGHQVYVGMIAGGGIEERAKALGLETITDLRLNRNMLLHRTLGDLFRLRRYLREKNIDILHCHLTHDHWLGALAAWGMSPPVTVVRTLHRPQGSPRADPFNHWLFEKRTNLVIVPSKVDAREQACYYGLAEDKIKVVNGAIDKDHFSPAVKTPGLRGRLGLEEKDVAVGMIAHFHPTRGHDHLLWAYSQLRPLYPAAKLIFIGEGKSAYRRKLEAHLKASPYYHDLRLCLNLEEDWPQVVASLDILVYLARGNDGTARTVLEAMAAEKPVIAAEVGPLPEMVEHEKSGFLIPPGDKEALATALKKLLDYPSLRQWMGQKGRQKVLEKFSPLHRAQAVEEAYAAAIKKSGVRTCNL